MADKKLCIYLSQRDQGDSPPGHAAEVVYETLVLPAMEHFDDFAMSPRGYIHEPGSISTQLISEMLSADLVIADLSGLSPSGYYELGIRHAAQLPTVLIADQEFVVAVEVSEFRLVRYPFDQVPNTVVDRDSIDTLVAAIDEALEIQLRPTVVQSLPSKRTPRERRFELAARIEETAEVIAVLRINSVGDAIAELRAIADELKDAPDERTPSALNLAGNAVLKVLLRILEQLATVKGSRFAISGAISLVLGGSGWPAVTAMTVALAYWEGKEAFLKAIGSRAGPKP